MKKIIALIAVISLFHSGMQAQAKQRKEMLLQIAALQVYIDYAKKGYSMVSKGLNFIGDAKRGEVNLHGDYFTSLLKINPKIKNYYKVAEIISIQFKIMKVSKKTFSELKTNDLFHGNELDFIERSFDRLLENCTDTLDLLLVITTDSKIELKDDQRIKLIDELHQIMLDDYDFCLSLRNDAKLLSLSKTAEKRDSNVVNSIYGL